MQANFRLLLDTLIFSCLKLVACGYQLLHPASILYQTVRRDALSEEESQKVDQTISLIFSYYQ